MKDTPVEIVSGDKNCSISTGHFYGKLRKHGNVFINRANNVMKLMIEGRDVLTFLILKSGWILFC